MLWVARDDVVRVDVIFVIFALHLVTNHQSVFSGCHHYDDSLQHQKVSQLLT